MGFSIVLQNERGQPLERVDDPKNLLHKLLPLPDDNSSELLRYIDWYGDTIFNYLQIPALVGELKRLEAKVRPAEDKALLRDIILLASKCEDTPHLYVKFYGD
ncbi:MAG: hypothetical protein ACRD8U_03255 [Pyrinomonadaceae bacterium]